MVAVLEARVNSHMTCTVHTPHAHMTQALACFKQVCGMVGCASVNMAEHIDMCIKHGPGQRCGNMSDETKDIMPSVSSAFSVMSSQLKVVVGSINMAQGHTHCKLDEVHTLHRHDTH